MMMMMMMIIIIIIIIITSKNWSHQNSNRRFREKIWTPHQESIQQVHYKNSYTRNITHNTENTVV